MPVRSQHRYRTTLASGFVLWLVPALCLFDALAAYTGAGWRATGAIEHAALGIFTLWLATASVLAYPREREALAGHWREIVLCGTITLLGWALFEVAAHAVEKRLRAGPPFHTRGAGIQNVFTPDPAHLAGIHDPSRFTTGADGVRAAAPPAAGQLRVLCLGGSTTECVYLDDSETWPALLPGVAPRDFWVGNVGISGFDTSDHLRFVQRSPLLNGVAVLVVQPGINDLWRYLADEVDAMDYGRFAPDDDDKPGPAITRYRPWWSRSRVIQLYHTVRQPPPPPEQQEGIGGREYAIRREKRALAPKTAELPSLDRGLAAYRERVSAMIEACRERGVPVLFTTQPVVWQEDLEPQAAARCWFGWLPDGRYLTLGALRNAMDRYNDTLREICIRQDIPCIDLSPLNGRPELFYDDCHFTEAGAREVATLVAPALTEELDAIR